MKTVEAHAALCLLVEQEKERIIRLWSKRVLAEVLEVDIPGIEIRKPLAAAVSELHRLLTTRPDRVMTLWPEYMRGHAQLRYSQNFEAADLVREMKALQQVLLFMYGKRHGLIEPEITEYMTELTYEATSAILSSYTRVLRTEEVKFKEAALMQSILHHVDIGILLAEPDGSIVYATPGVSKMVGLPLKAFLGGEPLVTASLMQMHARHVDGTPYRLADLPYQRVLKSHMAIVGEWIVFRRPSDNKEVMFELSATPIFDESPRRQLIGALQTLTDRTDMAQKNIELSKAYEELRKLQSTLLKRTRVQALGQLASGAAHTLNNLLNVMRLRLALLKREAKLENIEALDKSVQSIGDFILRLQEFSSASQEGVLTEFSVDEIVAESLELAQVEIPASHKGIEWKISMGSGSRVFADAPLLREVMLNLFIASAERLGGKGVIAVTTRDIGATTEFCIEDSGPRLSKSEVESLFEPWQTSTGKLHMSFLLSLGRSQIRQWGGDLECENRTGESGILCRLRLPRVEKVQEKSQGKDEKPALPSRHAKRVLVVDDDVETARMMVELLTEEGYEASSAHSALEALSQWQGASYDAALLDALMPEESGWELARQLRQKSPQTLLAMVTGADVRGQSRSNLAVVDAVFQKPIDIGALDEFLSQPAGAVIR